MAKFVLNLGQLRLVHSAMLAACLSLLSVAVSASEMVRHNSEAVFQSCRCVSSHGRKGCRLFEEAWSINRFIGQPLQLSVH